MNQTQVNNFLKCLLLIDDRNYLGLHEQTAQSAAHTHAHVGAASTFRLDDEHDHDHDHDDDADDHDHDHDDSESYDVLVAKITAMVVLFCASALCGSIPFMLDRYFKWSETHANARSAVVVKCLLYFGGGVLLCTTFLHLLPEVQELVEELQECGNLPTLSFSLAELLMCGGFFMMYFIEELIHTCLHRNKRLMAEDEGAGAAFQRGHSGRHSYLVKGGGDALHRRNSESAASVATVESKTNENTDGPGDATRVVSTISTQELMQHDLENQKYNTLDKTPCERSPHPHHHQHHHHHHHHDHQHQHAHGHAHAHAHAHSHLHSHLPIGIGNDSGDDALASSLRGLFIVLALSLHELFEGMAVGLEGDSSSVWFMFGAVSAHKLVLAFCVGVELIVARTRLALSIVYVLTFAVVSPIGIGLGILISHSDSTTTPSLTSALLQGLACGTLLYVVFFEILSQQHAGLVAYVALLVGYLTMFGLQQLTTDSHGHSHSSCSDSVVDAHVSTADSGDGGLLRTATPHAHSHHHHHQPDQHNRLLLQNATAGVGGDFVEQLKLLRQASQKLMESTRR